MSLEAVSSTRNSLLRTHESSMYITAMVAHALIFSGHEAASVPQAYSLMRVALIL